MVNWGADKDRAVKAFESGGIKQVDFEGLKKIVGGKCGASDTFVVESGYIKDEVLEADSAVAYLAKTIEVKDNDAHHCLSFVDLNRSAIPTDIYMFAEQFEVIEQVREGGAVATIVRWTEPMLKGVNIVRITKIAANFDLK